MFCRLCGSEMLQEDMSEDFVFDYGDKERFCCPDCLWVFEYEVVDGERHEVADYSSET